MRVLKKIISILIFSIFILLIFIISQLVIKNIIPNFSRTIIQNSSVAFFGAFFAFLFVKIGEYLSVKRKRNVEHYNAVIKFQHIFNKSISSLQHNIEFLVNNINALKVKRILTLSFYQLPIHDEFVYELKNIDFINEVYGILRHYENVNMNLETLSQFYNEVKRFFIEKKISRLEFQLNSTECIGRMVAQIDFLKEIRKITIRLFAISRILAKEDKNWNFFFGPHIKKHYTKDIEKKLQELIPEIEKEFQSDKNNIRFNMNEK